MKKIYYFGVALILAAISMVYISFNQNVAWTRTSGSPGGYTGSPGDGNTCSSCHGGTPTTQSGWITTDVPGTGYVPGSTYNITVTATGANGYGFELTAENNSGVKKGTFKAGTDSKLLTNSITHSAKSGSGSKTWNFTWTAPSAGTGKITFYGAFVTGYSNVHISNTAVDEIVGAAPVSAFSADSTSSCTGVINFTDQSTGSPTAWEWDFGDGSSVSTDQNPSHTYTSFGAYTVKLTVTNYTASDDETKIFYIRFNNCIAFGNTPTAAFTADSTISCTGVINFTDQSTENPTKWAWEFGDGNTSTDQNPSHTFASIGLYTIKLSATNAAGMDTESNTSYITVKDCKLPSGITEVFNKNSIIIYPNPITNYFSLSFDVIQSEGVAISIYDLKGSRVTELYNRKVMAGQFKKEFSTDKLKEGVYLIKFNVGKENYMKRIIIK